MDKIIEKGLEAQAVARQQLEQIGDATKAQIAQNKAAQAGQTVEPAPAEGAAAAQAPQPTESIVNPQKETEEVMAPILSNLSFEDRMRERFEKEYAAEKEKEAKRLAYTRLGHGISGLAASIGDMVRASEGAPVNPRDWQRIYDELTAQEKANVDNYNIRMQKLRDEARQERLGAANAAAQAQAASQKRQYDMMMSYIERNWKGDQYEKNRILDWLKYNLGIDAKLKAAYARSKGKGGNTHTNVMLGETSWAVPKGETMKNYIYSVVDILNDPKSYIDEAHKVSIVKDETLNSDPYAFYNKNVVNILRNHWDSLTEPAKTAIENSVKGHGGYKGTYVPTQSEWESEYNSGNQEEETSTGGAY